MLFHISVLVIYQVILPNANEMFGKATNKLQIYLL